MRPLKWIGIIPLPLLDHHANQRLSRDTFAGGCHSLVGHVEFELSRISFDTLV